MNKWWVPLLIGMIIGVFLGVIVGLFSLEILNIHVNECVTYGILEIVNYLIAPLGVLVTLLAVVVALWGNEFKNYLFREKSQSTVSENFVEILRDASEDNPEAIRYDCNLSIKNISSREIADCSVFLLEAFYGDSSLSKLKSIGIQNRIQVYWKYPDIDKRNITPEETAKITLLKILPDVSESKSDNTNATKEPRHLSIVGLKSIPSKYTRKGFWRLTYCVSNSHRELERFELCVTWTGVWKSRETEMNNEASIDFKKINK